MLGNDFSNKIKFTLKNGESFEIDQRRVQIRENQNGLMALSYICPVFDAMDLESFFVNVLTSEKLNMNIGDTGDFPVSFRGIIEGKGKNFPQNMDHKIILLQEPKCLDPRVNIQTKGFSRFKLREKASEDL